MSGKKLATGYYETDNHGFHGDGIKPPRVKPTVGCKEMTRKDFLIEFLGALGAQKLIFLKFEENRVTGTAVFDLDDPDEHQDFCWHSREANLPSIRAYKLARLIHEQNLLEIDKIKVERDELRERCNTRWKTQLSTENFANILDELEAVEVKMVDGKEEYDAFFIHE